MVPVQEAPALVGRKLEPGRRLVVVAAAEEVVEEEVGRRRSVAAGYSCHSRRRKIARKGRVCGTKKATYYTIQTIFTVTRRCRILQKTLSEG